MQNKRLVLQFPLYCQQQKDGVNDEMRRRREKELYGTHREGRRIDFIINDRRYLKNNEML